MVNTPLRPPSKNQTSDKNILTTWGITVKAFYQRTVSISVYGTFPVEINCNLVMYNAERRSLMIVQMTIVKGVQIVQVYCDDSGRKKSGVSLL